MEASSCIHERQAADLLAGVFQEAPLSPSKSWIILIFPGTPAGGLGRDAEERGRWRLNLFPPPSTAGLPLALILQFRDAAAIKIIGGRGDWGRQAAVDRIIEADHFTIKKFRQPLGLLLDRLRTTNRSRNWRLRTSGSWHRPAMANPEDAESTGCGIRCAAATGCKAVAELGRGGDWRGTSAGLAW